MAAKRDARGRFVRKDAILPKGDGNTRDAAGRLRNASGRFVRENNAVDRARSDTEKPAIGGPNGPTTNIQDFVDEINEWTINIVPELALDFQRAVAILAADQIVLKTPVRTGRARSNWIVQIGSIPTSTIEEFDPGGEKTRRQNEGIISAVQELTYIVIGNNLPYINTIEEGGYIPKDPENSPEANKRRAELREPAVQRRAAAVAGDPGAPLVRGGYTLQAPQGMVALTFREIIQAFGRGAA